MARIFFIVSVLAFVFVPSSAFAACGDPGQAPCSPLGYINAPQTAGERNPALTNGDPNLTSIAETLVFFLNWFAWFVGLAAVFMSLYSGFLFITARDDPKQIGTARKTMFYAIIGVAVSVVAFSIIALTTNILF